MTQPQTTETKLDSPLSVQNEINTLRDDILQIQAKITDDLPLPDHVRYISAISVAYTRLATLVKTEHQLTGGEDLNAAFNTELLAAIREMESEQ